MVALTTTVDDLQSLKITVPSADIIAIREFKGTESLSQFFEFSAFVVSTSTNLDFDMLLGQSVTVSFDTGSGIRYFNGIIGEIWQRETARTYDDNVSVYGIKFYPQFWLLKFSADCRIFQNMSVMAIVTQILHENLIVNVQNLVTSAGQSVREYCVQYNETNLDFINRLFEEEGIYYYFTHNDGIHTLVLGDNPQGHQVCPINNQGQFFGSMGSDYPENIIYQCQVIQRATVRSRSLADYNFTNTSTPLNARIAGVGIGGNVYRYPGTYDQEDKPTQSDLENIVQLQLSADLINRQSLKGKSTQPFFTSGHQFYLTGYDRPGSDGTYVIQSVKHHCTANTDATINGQNIYTNEFEAFRISTPFRPPLLTSKPRIFSTQTAMVIGQAGEEIWTDQYGRIMVEFHWDQSVAAASAQPSNSKKSCWIRVAEGWSGANWGTRFTPRIGMEVLVTFLDGNPDRPLVTGCVWNGNNMPPYLPSEPTKSTIKTRSTKGGGDNEFNEIRFEDLRGSEQVYHRAQKDLDQYIIQNATTHVEKGSQWTWIDSGDIDIAVLAKNDATGKSTPEGQSLPAGAGHYNLEITGGCWNIDQLSVKGKVDHNHYTVVGDYNYQIDQGDIFKLQKMGDWYQQLDKGSIEQSVQQGHIAIHLNNGDKHTSITSGDDSLRIGKGDQSTLLEHGTQYTNVIQGDCIKAIDKGHDYKVLKHGSHYTTLTMGDHVLKIAEGDRHVHILKGNQEKGLLDGNESNYINGNFNETVTKNYSLMVVEDLHIQVTGSITIESAGNIALTAGQNIALSAAENIMMTAGSGIVSSAGTEIQQAAGTNVSIESGVNLTLASGFDINCSAGACVAIESVLDTNIVGGIEVSIEGGASTTVLGGASVEVIGATIVMVA